MRGPSSRRSVRRGDAAPNTGARLHVANPGAAPQIDQGHLAATLARALAAFHGVADRSIVLGQVLQSMLEPLGAVSAVTLGRDGCVLASASRTISGLATTAQSRRTLIALGRNAMAGKAAVSDETIFATPLATKGVTTGALVVLTESAADPIRLGAACSVVGSCIAPLLQQRAPSGQAGPERQDDRRADRLTDRLIEGLARHTDGVALFDKDGGLVTANAAFAAAYGARRQDLKGLSLAAIVGRSETRFGPALLARDLSQADDCLQMALSAEGRWLRLATQRLENGDELVLQSLADAPFAAMAESRRRIEAAEAAHAELLAYWDDMTVGILVLERTGRISRTNPAACALLGQPSEALTGRKLGRFTDAAKDAWTPVGLPGKTDSGGVALAANARQMADGRTLVILATLPQGAAAPPARAAAAPASARKNSPEAERAIAATLALGELGHEMRTPLNAVIGFTDVLLARSFGPLNDRQAQYLEDIGGAGRHMLEMVDNMLDHAQLTAGRYAFDPEWLDLQKLTADVLRLLEPMAHEAKITLSAPSIPPIQVHVDRRGMMQALINLLANAIKFTPQGGAITVTAEDGGDGLRLTVKDTGEGIPASDLPRITQPFTQARRLGAKPLKGAGLGLSIVKAVVEMHQGELEIKSAKGDGSSFTIILPKDKVRALEAVSA